MKFKLQPYPHQMEALELSRREDHLALLWEMGTGKTGGMINILRDKYSKEGRLMRTLILSPLVTLFNWKNEFGIHSYMDLDDVVVCYHRQSKKKRDIFHHHCLDKITNEMNKDKVVITNYETLQNKGMLDSILEWSPEIVICDEAHLIKNPKAIRSKATMKVGLRAKHRFVLTGTLILNSIQDVFMPYKFMDHGDTFGTNYHVFRNTYMEDANAEWSSKPNHFSKWVARTEMYDTLTDKIYQRATRVRKCDVLKDLPPLVKTRRTVELGPEQKKYYEEMKRDFITFVQEKERQQELAGAVVAQLAVTKALRLLQIVTGYVTTEDGEDIIIQKNPRLDETEALLSEIVCNGGSKCILWCSFRANYKQLGDLCKRLNIEHVYLTGEMSLEEKQHAMNEFNTGSPSVIIANRRAGGIGINLVAADYSIVYSRNFSLSEELQSEARNHRGGSQIHSQITKIDLCARDTIDEHVLEALCSKEDISKRVIDFAKEIV